MNTIKTYIAEADIPRNTLVKFGTDEDHIKPAAAGTDNIIGATLEKDTPKGERVDVCHIGAAEIKFGGTVAAGEAFTSDADGKAVKAASGDIIAGYSLRAAVKEDIALAVICRN